MKRFLAEAGRAVLPRRPDPTRRVGEQSEHLGSAGETRSARLAPLESGPRGNAALPLDRPSAALALQRLAQLDRRALRALSVEEFVRGWHALLFLFPSLHPDNALDHGSEINEVATGQLGLPGFERELDRRHIRSGWPVMLEPLGVEAWRRYRSHQMSEDEFYCVEAQRAGLAATQTTPSPATEEGRHVRPMDFQGTPTR